MPFQWSIKERKASGSPGAFSFAAGDPPRSVLQAWPYRSLQRRGFVWFFAITFVLVLVPISALLGSPLLWVMLPFIGFALWLTWVLLQRSYRDGEILEELRLWDDKITLSRRAPRKPEQTWQANPYWIRAELITKGGPVDDYLILKGGPRTVELGAFLTPEERQELCDTLSHLLSDLHLPPHTPQAPA